MNQPFKLQLIGSILIIFFSIVDISCKEQNLPCDNLSVAAQITHSECDSSIGSIHVSASGGQAPYQYKLEFGTFQADPDFDQLQGGIYTLVVKDAMGCEVEEDFTVTNGLTYVADIKPIIQMNCAIQGCHVAGQPRTDFTIDDNAVERASLIKSQTSSKNMPEASSGLALSEDEIAKIACWADGGGPK